MHKLLLKTSRGPSVLPIKLLCKYKENNFYVNQKTNEKVM